MTAEERDKLIEQVVRQVLAALGPSAAAPQPAQKSMVLTIGAAKTDIPARLTAGAAVCCLENAPADLEICRFDKVVIAALSLTQLVDLAQGRASDRAVSVVLEALLSSVEVDLLERAIPHRAYPRRGSTALYGKYERDLQTLQTYGVRIIPDQDAPLNSTGRCDLTQKKQLITESEALRLLQEGRAAPADAILTPSAKDVFRRAKPELPQACGASERKRHGSL